MGTIKKPMGTTKKPMRTFYHSLLSGTFYFCLNMKDGRHTHGECLCCVVVNKDTHEKKKRGSFTAFFILVRFSIEEIVGRERRIEKERE